MPAVNASLQDRAIDHAHDLLRYSNGVVRRMIALLNRTDSRLVAQLAEALLRMERDSFTVQRLDALLGSVRQLNSQAYAAVQFALEADLKGLSRVEVLAQLGSLTSSVPSAVRIRFPIARVSADQVYAAAMARPFQGRLLREWAAGLEEGRMTLIRNAVRAGVVEGQTTSDIIRSIRGTRANGYADGTLNRPRRELAAVVQTAVSHTAQTARQQVVSANADIIKAEAWVSTLDTKTSPPCRIRDGLRYTPVTHEPIGHSVPWGEGPGRLHFCCRSVSVPVVKSWRELGFDAEDLSPGTRASMDGQVAADTTYPEWFGRQSAARQLDILGPDRYRLLKAGKVDFSQFYDDKGRWLSIDQLEDRVARASA
ncbi:phage minor head protein [Xylophilus sp.]|uniref:phage minor head protein n=1 Tax=Xylophilus sp. TaxID=2653893 RepID=UPI0013B9E392|nr:phage minor head protein [Xylophilus sp.]KAF1045615.1 MAG: hypothetical protein GAK38_02907 [Xylophilus sp.]